MYEEECEDAIPRHKGEGIQSPKLVQPMVEYVLIVWSPHQDELHHNIEMVQIIAARYVMARYGTTDSVTAMLQKLPWDTLEQQRLGTHHYGVPRNT